jgi:hypothetical protein
MKKLTIDEAEELAMETDYAAFASEPAGNEINKADAGAFFLEGYQYAIKLLNKSHLPQVSNSVCDCGGSYKWLSVNSSGCDKCGKVIDNIKQTDF